MSEPCEIFGQSFSDWWHWQKPCGTYKNKLSKIDSVLSNGFKKNYSINVDKKQLILFLNKKNPLGRETEFQE